MSKEFIHCHVHTIYSMLDGYSKIDDLIDKAKEYNMSSIAITDHGTLAGTFDFNDKCKKAGIKPLLGCEVYQTYDVSKIILSSDERKEMAWKEYLDDNNIEKEDLGKLTKKKKSELSSDYMYDTKGYHLILIAKNQTGWNNLIRLTSEANDVAMFNGRGHVDYNMLEKYGEGLICTTACIGSMFNNSLMKDNYNEAIKHIEKLQSIFHNDLYIEIQPLEWDQQVKVNKKAINIANNYNIKLIATNDVHYTNKEDNYEHDIMLCIGTGKTYDDPNRMRYDHEFWLRSYDEMIDAFNRVEYSREEKRAIENAMNNTVMLADSIDDNIQVGSNHELLPEVDVPEGYTPKSWLKRQCWTNLYKYLSDNNLMNKRYIYESRLKEELDVIITKGFTGYMLIVQDIINIGQQAGCSFGPGRGSVGGCLVAFLLGISKGIDPIEYGLLFFRFLTISRTANPDIDSDCSQVDRQKLLKIINDKYHNTNVTQVGTLTTLGVKNGIKDIMRVLDYSFAESNAVSKKLDEIYAEPDLSFKKIDSFESEDPELYKKYKELESEYPNVFKLARKFNGCPRNMGVHAGGVGITPTPINDIYPTRNIDGKKVTVWEKDTIEKAGIVKIDMLGLKTISVIELCLKFIKKNHDIDISLNELYNNKEIRNDSNVFNMLSEGKTDGVFQFESNLFKNACKNVKPTDINDLIAITAFNRPGPLSAGFDKKYANRKNGLEPVNYPLGCDDILGDTYGCLLYQEQCMLISKKVAGFDDNQADTYLRKSLAKKKRALIDLCRQWFIYGKPEYDEYGSPIEGGINRGYDEQELKDFFDELEGYASYVFNKSHAASYSLVSCITAWLKYYYPEEFFAALLTYSADEKADLYNDILSKQYGIHITVPDIKNLSEIYNPTQGKIAYGISKIKGVGATAISTILNAGPYESVEDFITKVNEYDKARGSKKTVNKTAIIALIKAGAFDSLGETNRFKLINQAYDIRKDKDERLDESTWSKSCAQALEIEVLNTSITYPLIFNSAMDKDVITLENCRIINVTEKKDKNGKLMAFAKVKVNDIEPVDVIVFSSLYLNNYDLFDIRYGDVINIIGEKDGKKLKFKKGRREKKEDN